MYSYIYIRGRDVESRTDVATSRCTKPAAARRSNQRRRGRPCGPREPSRERETRWKRAGNATFPLAGHPRCNIRHTNISFSGRRGRPAPKIRPCDWSDALFCGCFFATGCAACPRLGEACNAMHDVHAILLRQGCLLRAAWYATQSVSPGLFTSGCISGAVPRPVPTGRPETSTYCSGRAVLPDDAHATWMGPRRSATYCSTYCVCTVLLLGRGEGACAVHWRRSAYTRPPFGHS